MININTESLLTIGEAADRLRVTAQTLRTYMTSGANGKVLESVRVGGRILTSDGALQRFIEDANQVFDSSGELDESLAGFDAEV